MEGQGNGDADGPALPGPAALDPPRRGRLSVDLLVAVVVWLAGAAVFFREQWRSGFDHLMGNDGDTRLIAYLNEHWFQVLHGQASWRDPTFYYPVKDLLGWSESFFLYQVFYAPLRELGCDPFLALQLTVVLLSLVGFITFFLLVRIGFDAPRYVGLAGGLAFTFSNALWLHESDAQLSGIYLVPPVLLLALVGWRRLGRRPVVATCGFGGAALLAALLFFTSFYVAMFSGLATAIVVVATVVMRPRRSVRWVRQRGRAAVLPVGAAVVVFGVALIPFLFTYLPSRTAAGGTSYARVMGYAIPWRDLVNLGTDNVLWSSLIHRVSPTTDILAYEHTYSVTPVVILLVILGAVAMLWRLGRRRGSSTARAAVSLAAGTIVLWLLPLRTTHGSPWRMVWAIPGMSAIRAIDRIQIVTGLIAALTVTAAAAELARIGRSRAHHRHRRTRGRSIWVTAALAVVLAATVAEQLNRSPVSAVDRSEQIGLLASTPPAPAGCRVFYVIDPRPRPFFAVQIDAMLISQRLGLPTINGYTGYRPAGWALVTPSARPYLTEVQAWRVANGLSTGMCHLDLTTLQWGTDPPLPGGGRGG